MDKLWKKISGLFFASVMAVTLTGRANADNDDGALPEPAPTAVVESAPADDIPAAAVENAEAPAPAAEESAPAEEEPAPAAEEFAPAEEEPAPAAEEFAPVADNSAPVDEEPAPAAVETAGAEEESGDAEEESAIADEAAEEADAPAAEIPAEDVPTAPEEAAAPAASRSFSAGLVGGTRSARMASPAPGGEPLRSDPPGGGESTGPILVNDAGVKDISSETEITIRTAGFQHISKLTCDADVYIIGTGILLLDEVDLLQGCGVYLQSIEAIYGENGGTVALFVLDGVTDGVRNYVLVNGTYTDSEGDHVMPAILDEEYTVPAGINLIVPEGGDLVMQSVNALAEHYTDADGKPATDVHYATDGIPMAVHEGSTTELVTSPPTLTIASGAGLVISENASFRLNTAGAEFMGEVVPNLVINGALTAGSDVTGGNISLASGGTIEGSGVFRLAHITVSGGRADAFALNAASTWIHLNGSGADLSELHIYENMVAPGESKPSSSSLYYTGSPVIGSLTLEDGGSLVVGTTELLEKKELMSESLFFGTNVPLTVTGSVSGGAGSVEMQSGLLVISSGASVSGKDVIVPQEDSWGVAAATVYDYTGTTENTCGMSGSALPRIESDAIAAGGETIPVIGFDLRGGWFDGYFACWRHFDQIVPDSVTVPDRSFQPDADGNVTMAALTSQFDAAFLQDRLILLEVCRDGVYSYERLTAESDPVPASEVERIYAYTEEFTGAGTGGSTSTSTDTAYTGSGILGGSGAGSVAGGPRRLALTGSRTDSPDPDPTPDPEPAAQPADDLRVWAEESEQWVGCYILHIEKGGKALGRLAAPVTARMEYTLPADMEGMPLFAVFRDVTGELTAFEARYDPATGTLRFASDVSGRFVVVAFDYDGELFSEAFYEALAALDAVKALF